MLSCAAVVVTFFPDQKSIETIKAYIATCDLVVVVDNTPDLTSNNFPEAANLVLVRLGENMGLATALNRGIYLAGNKGYRYIFLFDQDSSATQFFFHEMLRFKKEMDKRYSNCAICAPNFL